MPKKYIIRKLEDALENMHDWNKLETISFSAGLEYTLKLMLIEDKLLDESIKWQYLPSMARFKTNEIWNTTGVDYLKRIKHDAFVYYCQLGFEYEIEFDPDMHIRHFLEDGNTGQEAYIRCEELLEVYYRVYARITSFSKYIPLCVDEMIATVHCRLKEAYAYGYMEQWYIEDALFVNGYMEQCYIEDVLFMYGILHEIVIMINEEKLIKGFIVSESGERMEASARLLKSEISSRELANREKRLRRAAAKKGFRIKKLRKKRDSPNDHNSAYAYDIYFEEVDGCGAGMSVHSIEEAEEVVLGSNS